MEKYVAVLGRQPLISIAELESLFSDVERVAPSLAEFRLGESSPQNQAGTGPDLDRLGGSLKIGQKIETSIAEFLETLPKEGKITVGVSDFTKGTTAFKAQGEALKIKRLLTKRGRSVRVVPNKTPVLSSAVSLHNHLYTDSKIELIKNGKDFYRVTQVQDIDAYAERDQARPARDAKVGMLPPKLAQTLVNLCGNLPRGIRLLDPFCGTGVVLQEAALIGYVPYGTDVNERMVEYSKRNLEWLLSAEGVDEVFASRGCASAHLKNRNRRSPNSQATALSKNSSTLSAAIIVAQGDATSFQWEQPIQAVACETYLGQPMSSPPVKIKLKQEKQGCKAIILGFLKNLAEQIETGTPVVIAVPAWLRPDGHYERLNLLDEIAPLRYNVVSFKNTRQGDLLYHREGQVVAREIIVLRKK